MKKSTKKIINNLKKYIGLEIIRTKPTSGIGYPVDWSYTDDPIVLTGFAPDGSIKYRHTGIELICFGNEEFILPFSFTDRNWITCKKAKRAKNNKLNIWKGKRIIRVRPSETGDESFINYDYDKAPTLVAASKNHLVIKVGLEGKTSILGPALSNPEDWIVCEK